MIIGLSGYISSGKDTVGKMIQYLDVKEKYKGEPNYSYDGAFVQMHTKWEIKKFAYKLKQIASILTGIPVEKFEDQEFKKTLLGKEWDSVMEIWVGGERKPDLEEANSHMTVREFLQKLGTDAIRNHLHPETWVNALFAEYDYVNRWEKAGSNTILPNWIITDCRFPNEAKAIIQRKGVLIRIERPPTGTYSISHLGKAEPAKLHPSETGLDGWEFDYVIENDGSIEDLKEKVKKVMAEINQVNFVT